jgi:hypothetical protein
VRCSSAWQCFKAPRQTVQIELAFRHAEHIIHIGHLAIVEWKVPNVAWKRGIFLNYPVTRRVYHATYDVSGPCAVFAGTKADSSEGIGSAALGLAWHPNGTRLGVSRKNGKFSIYDTRKMGVKPKAVCEKTLPWELNQFLFFGSGDRIVASYGHHSRGGYKILKVCTHHSKQGFPSTRIAEVLDNGSIIDPLEESIARGGMLTTKRLFYRGAPYPYVSSAPQNHRYARTVCWGSEPGNNRRVLRYLQQRMHVPPCCACGYTEERHAAVHTAEVAAKQQTLRLLPLMRLTKQYFCSPHSLSMPPSCSVQRFKRPWLLAVWSQGPSDGWSERVFVCWVPHPNQSQLIRNTGPDAY